VTTLGGPNQIVEDGNNIRKTNNNSVLAPAYERDTPISQISYSPSLRVKSHLTSKNESCSEMYSNSGFESTLQTPFSIGHFEKGQTLRNKEIPEECPRE
jgi:hypothetical protein